MIKAVAEQESLGAGFDSQNRPKILFERHIFHKLTHGKFDAWYPNISNAAAGGYGSSASQYSRFTQAFGLSASAAMMSASWGKFQILGTNFAICGFANVNAFVDAMKAGEPEQLDAFCEFVLSNHLDDELRRKDAAGFARGYNGPGYKKNNYDTLIMQRYRKFAKENIDCSDTSATAQPANIPPSIESEPADAKITGDAPAPAMEELPNNIPAPLTEQPPAVEVDKIAPAKDEPADKPEESELTKIGNKANAAYTAVGTTVAGIIAWFASSPAHIVLGIMGAITLLGLGYMGINALRQSGKDKRDAQQKRDDAQREYDLKVAREKQAFEIQLYTLKAAADPNLNAVRIVPPAVTIPNSDAEGK